MSKRGGGAAKPGRPFSATWAQGMRRPGSATGKRPRSAGGQRRAPTPVARRVDGDEGLAAVLDPALYASATMQSILGVQELRPEVAVVVPEPTETYLSRVGSPDRPRPQSSALSPRLSVVSAGALRRPPSLDGILSRSHGSLVYNSHFSGLQSIGLSGMTVLEELIEAAMVACERGRDVGQRQHARGAALLTGDGRLFTGCDVAAREGGAPPTSAERVAALMAVSDGMKNFSCIVIASDTMISFPTPDGGCIPYMLMVSDSC